MKRVSRSIEEDVERHLDEPERDLAWMMAIYETDLPNRQLIAGKSAWSVRGAHFFTMELFVPEGWGEEFGTTGLWRGYYVNDLGHYNCVMLNRGDEPNFAHGSFAAASTTKGSIRIFRAERWVVRYGAVWCATQNGLTKTSLWDYAESWALKAMGAG